MWEDVLLVIVSALCWHPTVHHTREITCPTESDSSRLNTMCPVLHPFFVLKQLKSEPVMHICTLFYCYILSRYAEKAPNKAQFYHVSISLTEAHSTRRGLPLPCEQTHLNTDMHQRECKGTHYILK